jgi:hypothetical protein
MGEDFVSGDQKLKSNFETNWIIDNYAYAYAQVGFLANLVKVFPSLATRPLYVTGESYAGTYIVSRHHYGQTVFGLIVMRLIDVAVHHEDDLFDREPSRERNEGCHW